MRAKCKTSGTRARSYIVNFDFNFYRRGLCRADNKIWRDRPAASVIFYMYVPIIHIYYNNVVIIFGKPSNEFRDRRRTACCRRREERVCFWNTLCSPIELQGRGGFYLIECWIICIILCVQCFYSLHKGAYLNII